MKNLGPDKRLETSVKYIKDGDCFRRLDLTAVFLKVKQSSTDRLGYNKSVFGINLDNGALVELDSDEKVYHAYVGYKEYNEPSIL